MPITKSAKKALKQSLKRKTRNLKIKFNIKNLLKEVEKLISQGKIEKARKLLPRVYKALDKAAKNKVFKAGAVARKKSRITKLINKSGE